MTKKIASTSDSIIYFLWQHATGHYEKHNRGEQWIQFGVGSTKRPVTSRKDSID